MGQITKIFLDTNIIIYFLERNEYFYDKVLPFFKDAEQNQVKLFSSSLSYMELLIPIVKKKDLHIEIKYNFLFKKFFEVVDINMKVARLAAIIRAKYRTKTPDSIQIACAIYAGCSRFVTSDKKLKGVEEINVLIIK